MGEVRVTVRCGWRKETGGAGVCLVLVVSFSDTPFLLHSLFKRMQTDLSRNIITQYAAEVDAVSALCNMGRWRLLRTVSPHGKSDPSHVGSFGWGDGGETVTCGDKVQ